MKNLYVSDLVTVLEDFAPPFLAQDWDQVGLEIGELDRQCRVVCTSLDVTLATVEACIVNNADLLVVHHPLLFRPLKEIRFDKPIGHLVQKLCEHKISVYAAHTNLDSTHGGLNDHLADLVELEDLQSLLAAPTHVPDIWKKKGVGLGRIGRLKQAVTLNRLAKKLKSHLDPQAMRIIGHEHQEIEKVAICSGSGGDLINQAIQSGADCYITGDVKYHQALDAQAAGLAVLDIGHYASEVIAVDILASVISSSFAKDLTVLSLKEYADPLRSY
jgi:GTP cyclohydrolase I